MSGESSIGHFFYDILPWLFYGNALDDTTKIHERLEVVVLSGLAKAAISLGIIKVLETA